MKKTNAVAGEEDNNNNSPTEPKLSEGRAVAGAVSIAFDPKLTACAAEMPVTDTRMARSFPGSLWRVALTAKPAAAFEQHFVIARS